VDFGVEESLLEPFGCAGRLERSTSLAPAERQWPSILRANAFELPVDNQQDPGWHSG
jgi:hypothetical protein